MTPILLTANDGTEFLTPGTADGVGTLRSTLKLYHSSGSIVGTATEASSTLTESYNGVLPAGNYFADIASYGGHAEDDSANPTYNPSEYYDMGAFFSPAPVLPLFPSRALCRCAAFSGRPYFCAAVAATHDERHALIASSPIAKLWPDAAAYFMR